MQHHHMSSKCQFKADKAWLDQQFHDAEHNHIRKPDELGITDKDYPPSGINANILNRIRGSMFGLLLGDALGAHVEFRPHSYLVDNPVTDLEGGGTWGLQKGQFTDDTSMALCLANSLIARRNFVPYDQLVRYKWWYRNGYMSSTGHCFDIGASTRQSIQKFEIRQRQFASDLGIPLDQIDFLSDLKLLHNFDVNCSEVGVAGNGALMRLTPVPLFFYRCPEKAVEYSGLSCRITHGDDKAYDACRYYAALIVAAVGGAKKEELTSNTFYDVHKQWFGMKALHPDIEKIARGSYKKPGGYEQGIQGKGFVVNALEAALWAFYYNENSFEKGALKAVNLGDDTDTTAAIYGQLAGAHYGYQKLPKKWLDFVYAKNFIDCVSNWIAYEGDRWFANQNTPIQTIPSTNSNHTYLNMFPTFERKALDPSGRIGFFYDACRDRIIESSSSNIKGNQNTLGPSIKCLIEKGDQIECRNLLRIVDFDDELRLSVVSNIVSPTGIALLIDYPYLINEYTRIFYYSYSVRQEALFNNKNIQVSMPKSGATHVITGVDWGIDVLVLVKFIPSDLKMIDMTLNNLCESLRLDRKVSDIGSLDQIPATHIYSNIPDLTKLKTLADVYHGIVKMKSKNNYYQPLMYIIQPIESSYSNTRFIPVKTKIAENIEQHLFRLSCIHKIWQIILDKQIVDTLNFYLSEQLKEARNLYLRLDDRYRHDKKRFQELIVNIRQGQYSQSAMNQQLIEEDEQAALRQKMGDFNYYLTSLKEKGNLIIDLRQQGFAYRNAKKYDIGHGDDDNTIRKKLIKNKQQWFLCSNDTLNKNNLSDFQNRRSQMANERKKNPNLNLIYVDFSYCLCKLDGIKQFSINDRNIENDNTVLEIKKRSHHLVPLTPTADEMINILLFGRKGAGKSTLINTLISHLKFKNYESALNKKTIFHILISFVFELENDIEPHFIQIGTNDPNEDYDRCGQYGTQLCKSYIFDIGNGHKIRLIDTPGIRNTGDKTQDEIPMQYILSYICNLIHLNVICVVMESNELELDTYQRYLSQMKQFLGENAHDKIIFCFTKCLSHQINLEQRKAQLKSKLEIPCDDKNTFMFDSTYFLHLTTERYRMPGVDHLCSECQESWSMANRGWNRLLKYVLEKPSRHILHQGLQRAEYVQLKVIQMSRPIVETMRNILRNYLLWETKSNVSIKLRPRSIPYPSAICLSCKRSVYQFANFFIVSDSLHKYRKKCYDCPCRSNRHIQIDYQLDYKLTHNMNYEPYEQLSLCKELLDASVCFAHFLIYMESISSNNQGTGPGSSSRNDLGGWSSSGGGLIPPNPWEPLFWLWRWNPLEPRLSLSHYTDPFLSHLNRMIDEENYICENIAYNQMNSKLHEQLVGLKHNYLWQLNAIIRKPADDNLILINELIERMKQIPVIQKQINIAKNMLETLVQM